MNASRLGLGTVQFGTAYGNSSKKGPVPEAAVEQILSRADAAGITLLDTATAYGRSERVLGAALPSRHGFRIVTKTPVWNHRSLTKAHGVALRNAFARSLEKLRQTSLYGLLLHDPTCLARPGCENVIEALHALRTEGLVQKIGVSIYRGSEIDATLAYFRPDIVQLPVNLLDQRLLRSGHVARLKGLGVELHARSLFLQGLLLMRLDELPAWTAPIRAPLVNLRAAVDGANLTPLQACIGFVAAQRELDSLIVGVTARAELAEIIEAADASFGTITDAEAFAVEDEHLVIPSYWPAQS
jgi:aryl-alcohol dehydrogenase-like predicted oxidoreductase